MLKQLIERHHAFRLLDEVTPNDSAPQASAPYLARRVLDGKQSGVTVLDLGCGDGRSLDVFRGIDPSISWFGIDLADSPEVRQRKRDDGSFVVFDGMHLPFASDIFDIVYSRQVFEHVRYPDALLTEVARVLKPGGVFIGSVAYLEPYHSYSIFNFTPYGVLTVFRDAGLEVRELRPGADGFTMILRQMLNRPRLFDFFVRHVSPVNLLIGVLAWPFRLTPRHLNFLRLQFSGHVCFLAAKPHRAQTSLPRPRR